MIFQNLHPQSKIWLYISPVSINSVTKKNISSLFKDFVDNYKKDPEKVKQKKQEQLERKKNKPRKNLFNFKFWEWMG